ncbi:MAG: hypothetical protein J7551_05645, partial [Chloroflexi bacterium]|nr:hypothetical protein [Chloroflexota bacterium]
GYWSERDSSGSAVFVVDQSGRHEIELNFSESSPSITGMTVEVTLRRNVILSTPFLIYAIGVGALGVTLMIAGAVFKRK